VVDLDALVARMREAGLPVELRIEGTARALPAGGELAAYESGLVQPGAMFDSRAAQRSH
jgi:hypothetical protein